MYNWQNNAARFLLRFVFEISQAFSQQYSPFGKTYMGLRNIFSAKPEILPCLVRDIYSCDRRFGYTCKNRPYKTNENMQTSAAKSIENTSFKRDGMAQYLYHALEIDKVEDYLEYIYSQSKNML